MLQGGRIAVGDERGRRQIALARKGAVDLTQGEDRVGSRECIEAILEDGLDEPVQAITPDLAQAFGKVTREEVDVQGVDGFGLVFHQNASRSWLSIPSPSGRTLHQSHEVPHFQLRSFPFHSPFSLPFCPFYSPRFSR